MISFSSYYPVIHSPVTLYTVPDHYLFHYFLLEITVFHGNMLHKSL